MSNEYTNAPRGATSDATDLDELERVVAGATPALDTLREMAESVGYGYFHPDNPHDFSPDAESCTAEEIAAHKAACEAYDQGARVGPPPVHQDVCDDAGHLVASFLTPAWGIGSYVMRDDAAGAARRVLLAVPSLLAELQQLRAVRDAAEEMRQRFGDDTLAASPRSTPPSPSPLPRCPVGEAGALTRAGSTEVIAYACGKCGTVVGSVMAHGDEMARKFAVDCCAIGECRCGKPRAAKHRILCRDCEMDAAWMREAKRFAAATAVDASAYSGPVFDESCDEYAGSLDEAIERIEDEDEDTERSFYVYACYIVKLPQLDAEDIISAHCERAEMHEGAHENCDAKSLQAALDAWHAEQKVESWMVDHSRVIVLDESAAAEYRAEYARRVSLTTESPDAD